jgi:pimeloyl-ACP methyl ester carboxylesterase
MTEPTSTPEWVEISIGEITLRGHLWPGDLLTIVLLHAPGDGYDLDRWRPLIPYLIGNKATVLAMDLRGHGASGGEWSEATSIENLDAIVARAREQATSVVLCAEGKSTIAALRAVESNQVDGLILLSPPAVEGDPLRGEGASKLFIAGSQLPRYADNVNTLRNASIGPALSVLLPTTAQGCDILSSEMAVTCRAHIVKFLNERRIEARKVVGMRPPRDEFLWRHGLTPRGESE